MSARCPEGHLSHDPDYCDQCGLRIVGGQERYGYRPEDGGRGAAYGAGAPSGRPADPYARRAPERDTPVPQGPGGGQGGYDPLGIRRAPSDAPDVADPPRGGGRGGDPYGGYGREGYPEEARPGRAYPSDPYGRDGYGRGADERGRDERPDPYGRERDDRAAGGGFAGRDDRTPASYGRDRDERAAGGGFGGGRGEPEPGGYPRGRDDRGGYGAPDGRGGYGGAGRGAPEADDRRGYREPGYGAGGGYAPDPLGVAAAAGATATPPAPPGQRERGAAPSDRYLPCPNCRSLYEPGSRFCETCGLDFSTGHMPAPGAVPVDDPGATSRQTGSRRAAEARHGTDPRIADPRLADPRLDDPRLDDPRGGDPRMGDPRGGARGREWDDAPSVGTWEAVVEAEREYYDSGDDHRVPFPAFYPRRVFALTESQMLIGRRSESRGIHPEIDLSGAPEDPGISRAHATLERMPDGTYAVRDPGSTNGTRLNDEPDPVEPGRAVPLRDGDRVYVGAWTRITVRAQ